MIKKQTKNNSSLRLEKLVIVAGLAIIAFGCAANIYSAIVNQRFIYYPLDYAYYLRYIILLSGGFAIGCLLQRKSKKQTIHTSLYRGVVYAALAMALFWTFDIVRLLINLLPGVVEFPMSRLLFLGMSLFAILTTLLIAYVTQYRRNNYQVSSFAKKMLIALFAIYELYKFVMITFYYGGWGTMSLNTTVGILTIPIVIAIVAFLLLGKVKGLVERLFYAVLIASLTATATLAFWELRTDASAESTEVFGYVSYGVTIFIASALIVLGRKAIR